MKIVFAGTTSNAAEILAYLVDQGRHEIVAVLSREDAPVGRKQVMTASPVSLYAAGKQLHLIKANRVDESISRELQTFNADLGFVVAYGALLSQETLEIPKHGWINVHYSLLPSWRGAAPVQRALMSGDKETGVTIFQLDAGMDTGPILSQVETTIEPDENAGELLNRLTKISISMLDETLASIEHQTCKPSVQVGSTTIAKKLSRLETRIDWNNSSDSIENLVRGANPEPMAFTTVSDANFRIITARAQNEIEAVLPLPNGSVFAVNSRVFVKCGTGVLELLQVQPASRNVMKAIEWLRGVNSEVTFE